MNHKSTRIIIFITVFFLLNFALGVFLQQPKKILIAHKKFDPYWRWHDFYALPPFTLDMVFLGSSHCYRGFDPTIFNRAFGIQSFNMGSSSQTPLTSYFVLKEILKTQKPKVLIFEVYFNTFATKEEFSNATYNFEHMRSSENRWQFMKSAYTPYDYLNFILPSMRYKFNLADALRNLVGKPITMEEDHYYQGNGYVASRGVVVQGYLKNANPFRNFVFKRNSFQQKQFDYLLKIIELCRQEHIQLILVTAPLPPTSLSMIKDYSKIHQMFADVAQRNSVPYIDYNTEADYMNLFSDDDFKDCDHLNADGVLQFNLDVVKQLNSLNVMPKVNGQTPNDLIKK